MKISIKKLPAGEKKKAPQGRFCIFTIAQNAAQDLLPLTPFATTSLVSKSQPVKCVFFVCGFATAKGCDGLCCCVAGFLLLEAGMFFAPEWGVFYSRVVCVCVCLCACLCCCVAGFLPLEAGMFFAPEWGGCVGVFVHVCAAVWLVFCLCKPGCFLLPIFSRMGCVCVCLCACLCCCVAGVLPLHSGMFFAPDFLPDGVCVWVSLCMSVLLCGWCSASASRDVFCSRFSPEWGVCVCVFVHVCAAVWLVFCPCIPGCFLLPIFSRMGCVCVSLCMSVLLCGCLSASASRDVSSSKILVCGGSLCAYVYCLHVMLLTCCVWLLACYGANMSLLFTWSVAHMLSC